MLDVGRKTVPDKGHLNRERPVTKALEYPLLRLYEFCELTRDQFVLSLRSDD